MSGFLRRKAKGALRRALSKVAPDDVETALKFLQARDSAAFPERKVAVERKVPRARVLVLSPPPR